MYLFENYNLVIDVVIGVVIIISIKIYFHNMLIHYENSKIVKNR